MGNLLSQHLLISTGKFDKEKKYWLEKLSGELLISGFSHPYDCQYIDSTSTQFLRPNENKRENITFVLPDEVYHKLLYISNDTDLAIFLLLLSGLNCLLYKYTGNEDIIVGIPVFKQKKVGEYLNNRLAIRNRVNGSMIFKDVLFQVKSTVAEANENMNYPLDDIVRLLKSRGHYPVLPLYDVMISLKNIHEEDILEKETCETVLAFDKSDGHMTCNINYNSALFNQHYIEAFQGHLINCFIAVTQNPRIKLADIEILSAKEKQQLLDGVKGNAGNKEYVYVLGSDGELKPPGVQGELYVDEEGIKNGHLYLEKPDLTSLKPGTPVDNPFVPGGKMYRTGFLGIRRLDGTIHITGSIKRRILINGFRVNPEEIERHLLENNSVKEAVVAAYNGTNGNVDDSIRNETYLCGYIVAEPGAILSGLSKFLAARLPVYMIPSYWVPLDEIPKTPDGEIDIKALPQPRKTPGYDFIKPLAKSLIAQRFKGWEFSRYLESEVAVQFKFVSIDPVEEKEYYVLSPAQKRLYILQQMEPGHIHYNMPRVEFLESDIKTEILGDIFRRLIARHESLRTSFPLINGEPVQRVHPIVEFEIERLAAATYEYFVRPFDLSQAPLLRVGLIEQSKGRYILMLDMHHIVSDGISMNLLVKDFITIYENKHPPQLRMQYKDYAQWLNRSEQKESVKKQELYWLKRLGADIPIMDLPCDFVRPLLQSYTGDIVYFEIKEEEVRCLHRLAKAQIITMYMVVLAVFNVLLAKLSGQEDIIVGTPTAGRRHVDLERIIGMFVNTLPLRNNPCGQKSFITFLKELEANTLEAFENQDYPFEELVENLSVERDTSRNPIFDVMFNWRSRTNAQPNTRKRESKPSKQADNIGLEYKISKFDMTLIGVEGEESIAFTFEYCTNLFKRETIESFSGYFKRIITSIIDNHLQEISGIEILSKEEKKQLLIDFNDTAAEYPKNKTIYQLFREQVDRTSDRTAVFSGEQLQITYHELNKKANQLAGILNKKGVGSHQEKIVGIMTEPSINMLIGILGILKTDGAYLPIDPDYPEERIDYMLKDSNVGILVSDVSKLNKVSVEIEVVKLSELKGDFPDYLTHTTHPTHLCYIIYTSGSTGQPKGVMVNHRSVINLLFYLDKEYPLVPTDTYLLKTSYIFDVSVTELFGWFLNGGRLAVLQKDDEKDPRKILHAIARHHVTHINFVPSMFHAFVENLDMDEESRDSIFSLKYIFLAGEALQGEVVNKFRDINSRTPLVNIYGPTEAAVYASRYSLSFWDGHSAVPIGKPVQNTRLHILDRYSNLQPAGVSGELYIGGEGLARGYLNRPELTKEKFVLAHSSWFMADKREKRNRSSGDLPMSYKLLAMRCLYKTGDLVRWLSDGNIEFLGRFDHQVKIRGYRVELGEIESRLLELDKVKAAVVVDVAQRTDIDTSNKYICAYIVGNSSEPLDFTELINLLSQKLPGYMVPSHFVQVDEIPLTSSGKVNRKVLPLPGVVIGDKYTAPRDDIELFLVRMWSGVLNIDEAVIGIDDNFFRLGGHSLKAINLITRIHKELNVKVLLSDIFKASTVRRLAELIKKAQVNRYAFIKAVELKEYYVLSSAQKRMYILHRLDPGATVYNLPRMEIFDGNRDFEKEKLEGVFNQLIQRHESLRTSFHIIDGEPVQRIHKEIEVEINVKDWDFKKGIKNFIRPFDLSQAPLLRVELLKNENRSILMVDMHHITADGISMELLVKEFIALFTGNKALPLLRIQYRDYAEWQNNDTQKMVLKSQEGYWLQVFEGDIPLLDLPMDYSRPGIQQFEGDRVFFEMGKEETKSLNQLSESQDATLYMVILAVFDVLLSRLSGQEDIVIGTAVAGRRHADLDTIIGMFVNTLALRNYPSGQKSFISFLKELKENTLEAFENQVYPFEDLVDILAIERDTSRNPIFDVMFNWRVQEGKSQPSKLQGEAGVYDLEYKISKFDMTLIGVEGDETAAFIIEYRTALFNKETIVRFVDYFKRIVASVIDNPLREISAIEILTKEEKNRLLVDFNDTSAEYPKNKTIHQLFEEQVARTPESVAVVCVERRAESSEQLQITYHELNKKANQLAFILNEKGVETDPNPIVGIMTESSLEMVIGILGILKAGAAYLPIDPDYPRERIEYMLKDSNAVVLLKKSEIAQRPISKFETNPNDRNSNDRNKISTYIVLNFEHLNFGFVSDFEFRASNLRPSGLAYVIYTSGTTGRSKGVAVLHRNAVNTLLYRKAEYRMDADAVALQLFSYAFDGFVTSFFTPLISSTKVVLAHKEAVKNILALIEMAVRFNVTHFISVPAMYRAIMENISEKDARYLRVITLAGDKVSPDLVDLTRRKNENIELVIEYGVTEASVMSTLFRHQERDGRIKIGFPIWNTQLYILDKYKALQPVGVAGELSIGGDGVALGYLNRPELTAEKFDKDLWDFQDYRDEEKKETDERINYRSYSLHFSKELYKTGDLARWLSDGTIEFLGRCDNQLKLRGLRIEPGEIENQLLEIGYIKDVVVLALGDEDGDKYLCAYVVSQQEFEVAGLRDYLTGKLPHYMIPSYFVSLERIPVTANGKLDRKSLPHPDIELTASKSYIAPRNDLETKMSEIWGEILGIDRNVIGIDVNFFHLGGHSLNAIKLITRLHQEQQVKVPLAEIFRLPTIRALSEYIKGLPVNKEDKYASINAVEKREYYILSSAQRRMYILQEMNPQSIVYNMPAVYPLRGDISRRKLEETFYRIIRRHESLRTSFDLVAGELVQRIHEKVDFEIEHIELPTDFFRPFDLSQAPLLRVGLMTQDVHRYILMVDMHHIVSDGLSMNILLDDYSALSNGKMLPNLPLQYRDYAQWLDREEQKAIIAGQEKYWLEMFNDSIPLLQMPLDFERPGIRTFEGNTIYSTIPAQQTELLNRWSKDHNITLNILLFSVYSVLLTQYTGQADMVIGSLAAGRNHKDLENVVGMFANFLPIRINVNPDQTFIQCLDSLKQVILDVYTRQDYPFDELVEKVKDKLIPARNPLFDTMLIVHTHTGGMGIEEANPEGKEEEEFNNNFKRESAALDFKVDILSGGPGELGIRLEYDTNLFKEDTMELFIAHYQQLIDEVLQHPDQKISEINILTGEEKQQLVQKRERNITSRKHQPLKLAVGATFSSEPIKNYIRWWGKEYDLEIEVEFAPYNQVFQQLLEDSSLISNNSGMNVLLVRFEDWIRDDAAADGEKCKKLTNNFNDLVDILMNKKKTVPYFVGVFPESTHLSLGPAVMDYLQELNNRWRKMLEEIENVYMVDFTELPELYAVVEVFDPVKDEQGHLPFSDEFYAAMGTFITRKIYAYKNQKYKVIALDCDNTLWKGICGEDGPLGVEVDGPYLELQKFMLKKYHEGMLLTLCSKNNQADVWEVFKKNTGMLLKKEHFIDWRINRAPKSENLKELANELGLGIDSLILLNSSPTEISEVEANCPQVLSLKLPENPEEIPMFLKHVWVFDRFKVSGNRKKKARKEKAKGWEIDLVNKDKMLHKHHLLPLKYSLGTLLLNLPPTPEAVDK
jgi:tyrocidine synthetase-3